MRRSMVKNPDDLSAKPYRGSGLFRCLSPRCIDVFARRMRHSLIRSCAVHRVMCRGSRKCICSAERNGA